MTVILVVGVPSLMFAIYKSMFVGRLFVRVVGLVSLGIGVVLATMLDHLQETATLPCVAPPGIWDCRRSGLMEISLGLDVLILGVAVTMVALMVVLVSRALIRPTRLSSWRRFGEVAVFVLGVLCFAGTRGHAHDRHDFASLVVERDHHHFVQEPPLQHMEGCEQMPSVPILEITADGSWIDGVRTDVEGLPQLLLQLGRNWSILHPAEPWADEIVLSVSPSTPMQGLEPWFDAMRDSHYQSVIFAFASSRVVTLGVRGQTDLRGHCGVAISLDHCVIQKRAFMTVEELVGEPSCGIVFP